MLELLTTLALIIILMGLMVSLARYVRASSAEELTTRILRDLELAQAAYGPRLLPRLPTTLPTDIDEQAVAQRMAIGSSYPQELLRRWGGDASAGVVRDAWGQPIGFLPQQHPLIGMAPQNRPFFFSAGPDGRYLTRQDNLYSYEQTRPGEIVARHPAAPEDGGQSE